MIIGFLLLNTGVFAQLSGPLSGILSAGVYTVTDEISVIQNDSLIIEPGVIFNFAGNFSFEVNGYFKAEGTEDDSIKFLPLHPDSAWGGIIFYYWAGADNKMKYCRISGSSEKGITLFTSSPGFSNCTISGNSSSDYGGGMYIINSHPDMRDCLISDNYAVESGGGIYCSFNSQPEILRCIFENNSAGYRGGGITSIFSSIRVDDSEIFGNESLAEGGGIFCEQKSYVEITNTMFSDNSASNGGGVYAGLDVSLNVENCEFTQNSAAIKGGGICAEYGDPTVTESSFFENSIVGMGAGIAFLYCPGGSVGNCQFLNNQAASYSGIYLMETPADIIDCILSGNSSEFKGGGIGCEYSMAFINNCAIVNNTAGTYAGGVRIKGTSSEDSPVIINCTIRNNHSVTRGGGLDIWLGQPLISRCIIDGNTSFKGAAFYLSWGAYPVIENCTISGNIAEEDGSAVNNANSNFRLYNSIVEGNEGLSCFFNNVLANAELEYNDIHDNTGTAFSGEFTPGLGGKVSVNLNGDSCDIYLNFFEDPLFTIGSGDSAFLLSEGSPCIDAGNPASPFDPDSTITDVGALWLNSTLESGDDGIAGIPEIFTFLKAFPNPFNPVTTLNFNLPSKSMTSLVIFDAQGREVAKLIDGWVEVGRHSMEFNASELSSGIYFARLMSEGNIRAQKLLLIK